MVAVSLALFTASGACADEQDASKEKDASSTAVQQLKENPDNALAIQSYVLLQARQILTLVDSDPEKAEKQLQEMREVIDSLEPTAEEAQQMVERAKTYIQAVNQRLTLARTTLEELTAQLKEKPADTETIDLYQAKAVNELYPLAMYQADVAQTKLDEVMKFLEERQAAVEDEDVKSKYETVRESLNNTLTRTLERGLELGKVIGQEAAPLNVEAWVNGEPLTDADLKGKVVLLDFWAVWCGPCIATFPHLREWHEKYADKGLVLVGLTRYYKYTWNAEAQRASRSEDDVTPEQEQEMLTKFAEHHELKHRFAIQSDDTLGEYYKVSGIPHVVLIDRAGKVRLFRIGSGEQNAKDVETMIEALLAESPATGG
jgi:thiol-disulfide isomerase/thioredoxin